MLNSIGFVHPSVLCVFGAVIALGLVQQQCVEFLRAHTFEMKVNSENTTTEFWQILVHFFVERIVKFHEHSEFGAVQNRVNLVDLQKCYTVSKFSFDMRSFT